MIRRRTSHNNSGFIATFKSLRPAGASSPANQNGGQSGNQAGHNYSNTNFAPNSNSGGRNYSHSDRRRPSFGSPAKRPQTERHFSIQPNAPFSPELAELKPKRALGTGGGHSAHSRPASPASPANPPAKNYPRARRASDRRKPAPKPSLENILGASAGNANKEEDKVPAIKNDVVRVITLGGVEQIGQNMTAIEIGDDIIVIDAGLQFKEEDTPGIDFILPNTKYLEKRKNKIRALLITHGHLDHIGGLPYIIGRLGNPPIYTRNLTSLMIRKRQEEFAHLPPLDIKVVEKNETITLGKLSVKFFGVTHTIPDAMGIVIGTPWGNVTTPGDFKLEHMGGVPDEKEIKEFAFFAKEKNLLLLAESTNIENPGFSTPEKLVSEGLEEIIKNVKGRLIIGTFASQFERMIKIIEIAEKYNRKVAIEGRSMKANIEVAALAGMLKPKKGTIIDAQEIGAYPPDRIIILATGAQGEEFAALMRMANKTNKFVNIQKTDTVVLSSSIIPGNERTVQKLKDNIARQGAKIIHYRTSEVYVHSTGHGNRGELEWLHKQIKPKFFIPIHGNHYMLRLHEELARSLGMPEQNIIVPDNGSVMDIINGEKISVLKEKAPNGIVMVDGFAVGDIQEVVIRDRQMLSEDGMFVIIASINSSTGKLKKSPDIISRGFVYLRESQELLQEARQIAKQTIEELAVGMNPINFDYIKGVLTDNVSRFLFQQTAKRPIVIPVLIGV